MKTKLDIIKILQVKRHDWCEEGIKRNLKILEKFKDTDTIDVIAKEISSYDALEWAINIGDREIMRDRVTDSYDAYWWALKIGDREIMIHRVTDSRAALLWARKIGDREIMRDRVTCKFAASFWLHYFGEDDTDFFVKKGLIEE